MGRKNSIWVFFLLLIFLTLHTSANVEDDVKLSLLDFFEVLSDGVRPADPAFIGWNSSSDPCNGNWTGVICNRPLTAVKRVLLEGLGLGGTLDLNSICEVDSLAVLSIKNNRIRGVIPDDFSKCKQLTQLWLNANGFSGALPQSLSELSNLKKLDISNNSLSGDLPNLARISDIIMFLVQNNHLTGSIPQLDFTILQQFNVSYNNFSGPVPSMDARFGKSSLIGNSLLCGAPLDKTCTTSPPDSKKPSKSNHHGEKILMYLGYILIAMIMVALFIIKLFCRKKTEKKEVLDDDKELKKVKVDKMKKSVASTRSEYSITSDASTIASPLVVLPRSPVKELKFEELLKAPAELLGRGRYGSLYKVVRGDGPNLAVRRIKDWNISSEDFNVRMQKIDQARHPNVLPPVAFFSSKQEKLVAYEYQPNGSLFKLLNGGQTGQIFDWSTRVNVASRLANAMDFMHKELFPDGIAHGNLKSSNVMISNSMEPCISEYGLMQMDEQSPWGHRTVETNPMFQPTDPFKVDIYNFGVILLELLTGKPVHTNGYDLARWVHSVVREEWTVEVFDNALFSEGSEEGMVRLLQVALKCIDASPETRPNMDQLASMINLIKEEDERSMVSEV